MKLLVFITMPFFLALKLSEIGATGHPHVEPHKTSQTTKLERAARMPASVSSPIYIYASCNTQNGAIIRPGHHDFNTCMNNEYVPTTHDSRNAYKQLGIVIPLN